MEEGGDGGEEGQREVGALLDCWGRGHRSPLSWKWGSQMLGPAHWEPWPPLPPLLLSWVVAVISGHISLLPLSLLQPFNSITTSLPTPASNPPHLIWHTSQTFSSAFMAHASSPMSSPTSYPHIFHSSHIGSCCREKPHQVHSRIGAFAHAVPPASNASLFHCNLFSSFRSLPTWYLPGDALLDHLL